MIDFVKTLLGSCIRYCLNGSLVFNDTHMETHRVHDETHKLIEQTFTDFGDTQKLMWEDIKENRKDTKELMKRLI